MGRGFASLSDSTLPFITPTTRPSPWTGPTPTSLRVANGMDWLLRSPPSTLHPNLRRSHLLLIWLVLFWVLIGILLEKQKQSTLFCCLLFGRMTPGFHRMKAPAGWMVNWVFCFWFVPFWGTFFWKIGFPKDGIFSVSKSVFEAYWARVSKAEDLSLSFFFEK